MFTVLNKHKSGAGLALLHFRYLDIISDCSSNGFFGDTI